YNLDPAYRAKAYVSSDRNYNWTVKISFHENSTPSYFHVVNGHDLDEIEHRKNNFNSFLKFVQKLYLLIKKEGEGLPLQPFNASCIGVHTNVPYTATLNLKYIELWFVAYLLAGIVIFFSAKSWSQNTSLHYGTGVSIGIMASVLILVIILYRLFPKGLEETRKALEDLRNYCRSPDCNAWKTLSRLKSPNRFAQFIEGDSMHITDEEILQYDSGPEPTPPIDPDDIADESDIEFELTSP
ncbi:hypothetical protein KUTeg_015227, partial [Tegillarca granosa]